MHRQEPEFEYIISRLLSHSITTAICLYVFILFFTAGSKVKCFDCNSYDDYRCADPFNWTTPPPLKQCEGCCVKIVQGIDTPEEKIRRTCTDELDINLFIVDHVCMSEGGGKGRMCFCEENECNRGTAMTLPWSSNSTLLWSYLILVLLLTKY